MRRIVTLMTVVVLVGLLAGTVLAGPRDRRDWTSRDRQPTIGVAHYSSRAYVPAPRRYVAPRRPVVVYPTPVCPVYTTYYPVVIQQPVVIPQPVIYPPVVYQPVPVVPIRPYGYYYPRSGFSISWSW